VKEVATGWLARPNCPEDQFDRTQDCEPGHRDPGRYKAVRQSAGSETSHLHHREQTQHYGATHQVGDPFAIVATIQLTEHSV
jgi:hypothetical protein